MPSWLVRTFFARLFNPSGRSPSGGKRAPHPRRRPLTVEAPDDRLLFSTSPPGALTTLQSSANDVTVVRPLRVTAPSVLLAPPGYYLPPGATVPLKTPMGYYTDKPGATAPIPAPPGTY